MKRTEGYYTGWFQCIPWGKIVTRGGKWNIKRRRGISWKVLNKSAISISKKGKSFVNPHMGKFAHKKCFSAYCFPKKGKKLTNNYVVGFVALSFIDHLSPTWNLFCVKSPGGWCPRGWCQQLIYISYLYALVFVAIFVPFLKKEQLKMQPVTGARRKFRIVTGKPNRRILFILWPTDKFI